MGRSGEGRGGGGVFIAMNRVKKDQQRGRNGGDRFRSMAPASNIPTGQDEEEEATPKGRIKKKSSNGGPAVTKPSTRQPQQIYYYYSLGRWD